MNAMIVKHNRKAAIISKVRFSMKKKIDFVKEKVEAVVEAVVEVKRSVCSWFWRTVMNVLSWVDATLDAWAK